MHFGGKGVPPPFPSRFEKFLSIAPPGIALEEYKRSKRPSTHTTLEASLLLFSVDFQFLG